MWRSRRSRRSKRAARRREQDYAAQRAGWKAAGLMRPTTPKKK